MTIQEHARQGSALVPEPRAPLAADRSAWRGGVIACVDTGLSRAVLDVSAERAASVGCCVVVYATDSARHRFASLRPTRWSGDGTRAAYEHPLDPVELYVLGQQRLAVVVADLVAAGVRAAAWLPSSGDAPLAVYAARSAARAVVVSASDRDSLECVARFRSRSHPAMELVTVRPGQ